MGRTTIPAALDRCSDKVQEKKSLKHFLQDHFWITKTFYIFVALSMSVIIAMSLEWRIIKNFFPGIFCKILLTLEFMSAEAICMAVISLFY